MPATGQVMRIAIVALVLFAARTSSAQLRESNLAPGAPFMETLRAESALVIDGRLDEAAWADVEPIDGFRQFEPDEGDPASQPSVVYVLYDARGIYVGALLHDDVPEEIEASLGRRDEFNRADWFFVSIDSYFDRKTAYSFGVNAGGVQFDAIQTSARRGGGGGGPNQMDASWDAIWESSQRITPEGWVVEMRIPYSMLRFSDEAVQTWGIQFTRVIPRYGEQSEWPHVPRTQRDNLVAHFGQLAGIEDVEPRSNLQVTPYTVARMRSAEDPVAPGALERVRSIDVGGDVKMGLGPNVTLDATFNPDFGQVEADPAVLNLTAFETVLDERRPFFIEGMQIYQFDLGPGRLPYTRRIGASAPIVGAAKISGRSAEGLSFGLLGAATGHELDPDRFYGLARVTKQIAEYSTVGGIATVFDGPKIGSQLGTELGAGGRSRSIVAGVDYDVRLSQNRYGVEGFGAFTHRTSTAESASGVSGYGGKVLLAKRQGVLTGFTGVEGFSDDAEFNDLGRVQERNIIALFLRASYDLNGGRPFGPFQRVTIGEFGNQRISFNDRLDQGQRHSISSTWLLRSLQEIDLGVTFAMPFGGYDIFETRGLGPWARPPSIEFEAGYQSDLRRSWQAGPNFGMRVDEDGGRSYAAGVRGSWTAGSRVELNGSLEGEWEDAVTAWTANETFQRADGRWSIGNRSASPDAIADTDFVQLAHDPLLDVLFAGVDPWRASSADVFFVPVFGARDTRSMDLTLRGTVTLTPNLSLQLYGQLFLASGRYQSFGLLRDADDLAAFDAYPKRDDFSFGRLQSNTVVRWEYRPGSTLFVVWTHGRSSDHALNPLGPWGPSPYGRSVGDQITDTFDVLPDNVFLIKLNYTFLR
jgi:hypothetical protein